jgi:hypothetical protein
MQELRTDRRPPGDSTLVMDPPQASSRRCGARRVRPARSSVLALHPSCHNNRDHLKSLSSSPFGLNGWGRISCF